MTSRSEVAYLGIEALAAALDRRELSSREVTGLMLERIAHHDRAVNGYINVTAERALAAADAADARRLRGDTGPLLGVPVAIKDLCDMAGVPTTAGSRILRDFVPERDSTVVARLRAAGAVILGKTHMAEFAYGFPHPDYGPSRTPWDTQRSASGSSGGSGAVVAAGLAYGAVGSDTGGSIRGPAAYCAITGHKPTYGLVSRAGVIPLAYSMDHVGPMTRSARDAMYMLAAMAGRDHRDPASSHVVTWAAPAERLPNLRGLRIGVLHQLRLGVEDAVVSAFDAAVEVLGAAGAELSEVDVPDLELVNDIGFALMEPEAASYHSHWLREMPDAYAPQTRLGLEAGHAMLATHYVDAQRLRLRFNRQFHSLFERCDVLCSPTVQTLPTLLEDAAKRDGSHQQWDLRHTILANVTGIPAVAVPSGFSSDGLPASIQFMAAPFDDARALQVAEAFQMGTDWHTRRPPGFD